MNNAKRKKLRTAVDHLDVAAAIVEDVTSDEESSMDNMPESLQDSEKYYAMEDAVNAMQSATDSIEEAICYLNEVVDS